MKKISLLVSFVFVLLMLNASQLVHARMVQDEEDPYRYFEKMDIVKVELGPEHAAAITSEGRLFTWGRNSSGQLGDGTTIDRYTPTEITGHFNLFSEEYITELNLGRSHAKALTSEGRIFLWGGSPLFGRDTVDVNDYTPNDITHVFDLLEGEKIIKLSSGFAHYSALTSEGRLLMWGQNWNGRLGDGTTEDRSMPTDITRLFELRSDESLVEVSLGLNHSSALTSKGRLFTWGFNGTGQLGNGTFSGMNDSQSTPLDITGEFPLTAGETIVNVALGGFSAALTSSGRVFTWGTNSSGSMGDGTFETRNRPVDITTYFQLDQEHKIVDIALGNLHASALTSDGQLFSWGNNRDGQVGDGTREHQNRPVNITNQVKFHSNERIDIMSLNTWQSSFITSRGRLFVWGSNSFGQLGNGTETNQITPTSINNFFSFVSIAPTLPSQLKDIKKVAFGDTHSLAVTSDNRVLTWGSNINSQLGDGYTFVGRAIPFDITDKFDFNLGETIVDVSLGHSHSALLTSKGRVFFWGSNTYGQLGDGTIENRKNPVDVTRNFSLNEEEIIARVILGGWHSAALTSEGRIFMWGRNDYGQLGRGNRSDWMEANPNPVDTTNNFNLFADETIVDISLGLMNSAALTSHGRVFTWGVNWFGQLGGSTPENILSPFDITHRFDLSYDEKVSKVLLGYQHSTALTTAGRVLTWGDDSKLGNGFSGDQDTPVDISVHFNLGSNEKVTTLSVGGHHSSVTTSHNRIFTWGWNHSGQLGDGTKDIQRKPIDITHKFMMMEGETISEVELGRHHSAVLTSEGRSFAWGGNDYGQLGIATKTSFRNVPTEVIYTSEDLGQIARTHSLPIIYRIDEDVKLSIFPRINISDVQSITINEVLYDNTHFTNRFGRIDVFIPNKWDFGDEVTFTLQRIILKDGKELFLNGNITTTTMFIRDVIPPTFDEISTKTIEAVRYEAYEWTTLIKNAKDNVDDELIFAIEEDNVQFAVPGTYSVTVSVSDQSGNKSTQTFHVIVEDTTPPTFDVLTDLVIELTDEKPSFLEGITAYDLVDGDVTEHITVDDSKVDYTQPGEYTVTYRVSDQAGNTQKETITLHIIDRTPPIVHLNPSLDTIIQGQEFGDAGVNVSHLYDVTTEISGHVNTDVPGVYTLTYTVTDVFDNVTTVKRIVTVLDSSPTIEFRLNPAKTTLRVGEVYQDTGCVVYINGNEMTCQIKENNVDTTQAGVHTMVYSISYQGEEYTYTRYIFVKDGDIPLTLYYDVKRREGDELI